MGVIWEQFGWSFGVVWGEFGRSIFKKLCNFSQMFVGGGPTPYGARSTKSCFQETIKKPVLTHPVFPAYPPPSPFLNKNNVFFFKKFRFFNVSIFLVYDTLGDPPLPLESKK